MKMARQLPLVIAYACWMSHLLFCPVQLVTSFSFLPTRRNTLHTLLYTTRNHLHHYHGTSRCWKMENTIRMSTIRFHAVVSDSIDIVLPSKDLLNRSNMNNNCALTDFLGSEQANTLLLGTSNALQRDDGLWECLQPPVPWFGLEIVPAFVTKLGKSHVSENKEQDESPYNYHVNVSIVEARTDIRDNKINKNDRDGSDTPLPPKKRANLIQNVMDGSTMSGSNMFTISPMVIPQSKEQALLLSKDYGTDTTDKTRVGGWLLTSDFSLTLEVAFPEYLPVPPGFNAIGSRIIKRTCTKRVKQNLIEICNAYVEWATATTNTCTTATNL